MEKSGKIFRLYGIVGSEDIKNGMNIKEAVEQAVNGGVTMIQLRERNKSEDEIIRTALELKKVCHSRNVPLVINDSVRIAYKCGADGVHLGLEDGDLIYARRILGENVIIGATAHNLYEAQAALAAGVDYLACGTVFASPSKRNRVDIEMNELEEICEKIKIPIVAIGGINEENVMKLRGRGLSGAAIVSSVFGCKDIKTAAMLMKNLTGCI